MFVVGCKSKFNAMVDTSLEGYLLASQELRATNKILTVCEKLSIKVGSSNVKLVGLTKGSIVLYLKKPSP